MLICIYVRLNNNSNGTLYFILVTKSSETRILPDVMVAQMYHKFDQIMRCETARLRDVEIKRRRHHLGIYYELDPRIYGIHNTFFLKVLIKKHTKIKKLIKNWGPLIRGKESGKKRWAIYKANCRTVEVIFFFNMMWNTFSVSLSRTAESVAEAISLALHSVTHALNLKRSE